MVAVAAPGRVAAALVGADSVGREVVSRGPADGICGVDVRAERGRVWPGSADGGGGWGAIDVAETSVGVEGGGAGEVVPIVDSPGPAGCTGSGGPAR